MSTPTTVAEYIQQFKEDVARVHQFGNGGPTEFVQSEGGDYPTLQNLVAQYRARIETLAETRLSGLVIRQYEFSAENQLVVIHDLNTEVFDITVVDDEGVDHLLIPLAERTANSFTLAFAMPVSGRLVVRYYTGMEVTALPS